MPKLIAAIDPGNIKSALILWDGEANEVLNNSISENHTLLEQLAQLAKEDNVELVIEMVACYGMKVGATIFDTCVWIGRFKERWLSLTKTVPHTVFRKDIKMHLTNKTSSKDSHIRKAIIDRFGTPKSKGIKNKVTNGLKYDEWQALALAVYWYDKHYETATIDNTIS